MGTSPEPIALAKLQQWAKKQGIYHYPDRYPIYGFNNPDPQEGKEEYGYEFWIVVDDDFKADDVEIREFPGGHYAVTTTKLFPLNQDNVIPAWPRLVQWAKDNDYAFGTHQWLEKALTPDATEADAMLDLYLPIE
jgi:DNA gyrase inhibitor GyrI